jgi:hypothetical protein
VSRLAAARVLALAVLVALLSLAGCGTTTGGPTIEEVRPDVVAPGGLLLLAGRGFDRADAVWMDGREVSPVSWVNAGLLATVIPAGLPDGRYSVEVRSSGGRRAVVSVNVAAVITAPAHTEVPLPAPTAPPSEAAPPAVQVPAAPAPRAEGPPPRDDHDKKEPKGGGSGKGRGR